MVLYFSPHRYFILPSKMFTIICGPAEATNTVENVVAKMRRKAAARIWAKIKINKIFSEQKSRPIRKIRSCFKFSSYISCPSTRNLGTPASLLAESSYIKNIFCGFSFWDVHTFILRYQRFHLVCFDIYLKRGTTTYFQFSSGARCMDTLQNNIKILYLFCY